MSVVQMGSVSDFELLIRVFLVLKCRCLSEGIATMPFIIMQNKEKWCSRLLSASGFQSSLDTILVSLLRGLYPLSTNLAALRCTLSNLLIPFL